jgi:hypothetical protein
MSDLFVHEGVRDIFPSLTNNFDPGAVLLSFLVFDLQKSPSPVRNQDTFRSFYFSVFSSWSEGIGIPSFVLIGISVLELEASITHNFKFVRFYLYYSTRI